MQEIATGRLAMTSTIVAAYVGNHEVAAAELPGLIGSVFAALGGVDRPAVAEPVQQEPAVPVRKSVQDDHIVCLEDGRKLKTLKRHLRLAYGMTPADYRRKWGLPRDYPMVAPAYAERRSALAKRIGLGRKAAAAAVSEAAPAPAPDTAPGLPQKRRAAGRKKIA